MTKLETHGMMDDTAIIITSDHGSSYLGKVFRNELVSTFYDENYRIPLLLFSSKGRGREIANLATSTQFIPTVLDFLGLLSGDALVSDNSALRTDRDFVIFEYFGPGCPDYTRKPRLFCLRTRRYKIHYLWNSHLPNGGGEVTAIYDLARDPLEICNVKQELIHHSEICYLVDALDYSIRTRFIQKHPVM